MATIRINKELSFRVELPRYKRDDNPLTWHSEQDKESLLELGRDNFDQLIKAILAASDNARIVDNKVGFIEAVRNETLNFIKFGQSEKPPTGHIEGDFIIIQGDNIVIEKAMLDSLGCNVSLGSFARMRNIEDSYLTEFNADRIVISSNPTSEQEAQWQKWNETGTDMEVYLKRKRHLEQLRNGEIQQREDKVIFRQLPQIGIEDNSINRAERIRRFIQNEANFLRNFGKR